MGINDLNTTFAPLRNSTNFKANNDKTTKTPEQDKKDTKKKVLVSAAAIGTATLAAVYGVKKYNVMNIKNIQKTFNETFMRDDITPEMAKAMKARYLEIEKIKDREEYAKALFEEAKKNYGLKDSPIKLIFEAGEGKSKNAYGYCKRDNSAISICPKCPREDILDIMHHEFRHAKQHQYLPSFEDLKKYAETCVKNAKEIENPRELASKIISESYNSKESSVPEHLKGWYDKIKQGASNYSLDNYSEYYNNFTEVDARKAGRAISKFVRGKAFTPMDYLNDVTYLVKKKSSS